MEFESEAQREVYERVARWMRELYGEEFTRELDGVPGIGLAFGSATAYTVVTPRGEDDAVVKVYSLVVTDVQPEPDLMHFLLTKNVQFVIGRFGLDEDDDIVFYHALRGSSCDKEMLRHTVRVVIRTADQMDDEIVARWGGARAADR